MKRKAIRTSEKRAGAIVRKRESEIREIARAEERKELTRFIYVKPDRSTGHYHVELEEPPKEPRLLIHLAEDRFASTYFDTNPTRYLEYRRMRPVMFRAVRKSWSDGDFTTVHWWDWEPCQ